MGNCSGVSNQGGGRTVLAAEDNEAESTLNVMDVDDVPCLSNGFRGRAFKIGIAKMLL